MNSRVFSIKTITCHGLDLAVEWAANEGWNPGLSDADCYYQADPNGFLMGFLDDEPIGSISVVKYGDAFGFLGFYIVKPKYRGQGYGIQLWQAGLEYLNGVNTGLDGVVEQQDNYKKSGFTLAYGNVRYQGQGGDSSIGDSLTGNSATADGDKSLQNSGFEVVNLSSVPFVEVDTYDQAFFPAKRTAFTKAWITQPKAHALGVILNGKLAGYGVIRPCHTGYKIGPLFADQPHLADALFVALKSKVTAKDAIFLDVPSINSAAVALAEKYDMSPTFETARMYTQQQPNLPLDRTFGVTSFEIG